MNYFKRTLVIAMSLIVSFNISSCSDDDSTTDIAEPSVSTAQATNDLKEVSDKLKAINFGVTDATNSNDVTTGFLGLGKNKTTGLCESEAKEVTKTFTFDKETFTSTFSYHDLEGNQISECDASKHMSFLKSEPGLVLKEKTNSQVKNVKSEFERTNTIKLNYNGFIPTEFQISSKGLGKFIIDDFTLFQEETEFTYSINLTGSNKDMKFDDKPSLKMYFLVGSIRYTFDLATPKDVNENSFSSKIYSQGIEAGKIEFTKESDERITVKVYDIDGNEL